MNSLLHYNKLKYFSPFLYKEYPTFCSVPLPFTIRIVIKRIMPLPIHIFPPPQRGNKDEFPEMKKNDVAPYRSLVLHTPFDK